MNTRPFADGHVISFNNRNYTYSYEDDTFYPQPHTRRLWPVYVSLALLIVPLVVSFFLQ